MLQQRHLICVKVSGRTEDFALRVSGDAGRMLKEDPGRAILSLATPTALQIKHAKYVVLSPTTLTLFNHIIGRYIV